MVENVDEIVRKLTPVQCVAIANAQRRELAPYPARWVLNNPRVTAGLKGKGLAYEATPLLGWRSKSRELCLTELGLAVRSRLNSLEGEGGGD